MNNETLKKLLDNPDFKAFAEFMVIEAQKLNHISDMDGIETQDITIEVLARKRAFKTLQSILEPILNYQEVSNETSREEYIT